jgi:hypothetical protein
MKADDQKRRWLDNHPGLDLQSSDPSKSYQHNRRPSGNSKELQLSHLTLTGAQTILPGSSPPVVKAPEEALEGSETITGRVTVSPASGDHSDTRTALETAQPGQQASDPASQKKTAAAVRENSARPALCLLFLLDFCEGFFGIVADVFIGVF